MKKFESKPGSAGDKHAASFIPDDYIERKADRRMGFITLALFCVVLFAVVGAFFVTNREWTTVRKRQQNINEQYTIEAKKIEQLKILETQKQEMLEKAEITTALIERVPRSILLAELINRMPEELTLTEFRLIGKRIQVAAPPKAAERPQPRSLAGRNAPRSTADTAPKPAPPSFEFHMELIGLAATDDEVADYHASLLKCALLDRVDLLYSGEVEVKEVRMRKFRIEANLRPNADARNIEPLQVPRLAGPNFKNSNSSGLPAGLSPATVPDAVAPAYRGLTQLLTGVSKEEE